MRLQKNYILFVLSLMSFLTGCVPLLWRPQHKHLHYQVFVRSAVPCHFTPDVSHGSKIKLIPKGWQKAGEVGIFEGFKFSSHDCKTKDIVIILNNALRKPSVKHYYLENKNEYYFIISKEYFVYLVPYGLRNNVDAINLNSLEQPTGFPILFHS